ncbi:GntR family transcriptional regulator [Xanthobacter sediminis]|uniref:GntR family transcriptional regulator n=1 Tax=Xanthobacter sediminis TaxID=3119926 RepID=UPI00372B7309
MDEPSDTNLSRAEYAYQRIRDAIRSGEFQPGQRLREADLAEHFKVSRTPIREAIRRITADGLLELVPGRGLAVAQFSMQQVREIYFLRAVLEGAAAALAAQYASPSEVKAMADLLDQSAEVLDDPGETARFNRLFHQAIYEAARNRYLSQALAQLADALTLLPGTTFEANGRSPAALEEHRAILDAITAHAAEEAENAARIHIRRASETRIDMMFRTA